MSTEKTAAGRRGRAARWLVCVGLALLAAGMALTVAVCRSRVCSAAERTLGFVVQQLARYEACTAIDQQAAPQGRARAGASDDAHEGAIALSELFAGYDIRMDGVIVVTDGARVVSTNAELLAGVSVREFQALFQRRSTGEKLSVWSYRGHRYLGASRDSRGYTASVLFPARSVYAGGVAALGYGLAIYILFCILFALLRQRAQHTSLAQIEKQYDTINAIGEIFSGCLLVDPRCDQIEIVKAPEEMLRFLRVQEGARHVIAQLREEFVEAPYREEFAAFCELRTLEERLSGARYLQMRFAAQDGRWFRFFLVAQHYDRAGDLTGALLVFRDFTQERLREIASQKQLEQTLEQAERASRAKTEFLRRMSHDIRTPINGIRGMVDVSRDCQGDAQRQEECRGKIMAASGYLLELVNDVLDMSNLDSGNVRLEQRSFDLKEVLDVVVAVCETQARERGVRLIDHGLTGAHRRLLGSPIHLQRVCQNIAANAVRYNRPGGTVELSCREVRADAQTATFSFVCADTGVGMSEEFQKVAFEPFAQEHSSARTNYGGTGLGLAIAQELVGKMGGEIRFESRKDVGTTFYITLSFALDQTAPAQEEQEDETVSSINGMNILLVEDNALNMEIAAFMLRRAGAVVTELWNGEEALAHFAASEPGAVDVIVMDVMMPVMDGLAAAQAIRALDRPDAKTVPILAMSASTLPDDVERSLRAGMDAHLAKPIDAPKLVAAIHRCRVRRGQNGEEGREQT